MDRKLRVLKAAAIYTGLDKIDEKMNGNTTPSETIRLELKSAEAKLSTLRLIQSERRMLNNLLIALIGVLGGATMTLLLQKVLSK
jgi:hypothetical protein